MSALNVSRRFSLSFLLTLVFLVNASVPTVSAQQNSFDLDVSGRDGSNASHGTSYSTHSGASSGRGHDGGNAGASSAGRPGKNVNVHLKDLNQGQKAYIEVMTEIQGAQSKTTFVNLTSNSRVRIDSRGGKGGHGGDGGDGQGGCNGRDGRDSSSSSSRGEDGSNGCSGGDAGHGSSGSEGGDGGEVRFYIPLEDIHLALITECQVKGGDGGRPGNHGDVGRGGHGGAGGRGYYARVYKGQKCAQDKMVNNGNGSYEVVAGECTDIYETVTTSPGSSGFSGSSGSRASGSLYSGRDGRDGVCAIVTSDGKRKYESSVPFQVRVESYTLTDEDKNGIFEPGEMITVSQIKVRNLGGLPSPAGKSVFKVMMKNTAYTSASEYNLTLPSLAPGKSLALDQNLQFRIKANNLVGQNERLALKDQVSPSNHLTRIERAQPNFENHQNIVITYPIEITAFSTAKSIGAGETIPIFWKVKNISKKDFGGESELKRSIHTFLKKSGGDASASEIKFISSQKDQSKILTEAHWDEILNLKAGQEKIIEGFIEVSSEAMAYTEHELTTDLVIKNFVGKDQMIQSNALSLRISQLFNYNPKSEFLLITNDKTTRPEFLAWKSVVDKLGTSVDVWDLSYYGVLSFNKALKELDGKALKDVLSNKTIVALNNESRLSGHNNFSLEETIRLLSQKKSNFMVLGGSKKELLKMFENIMTIPLDEPSANKEGFDIFKSYSRLAFWSSPSQEDFLVSVQEKSNEVLKKDPKSRFFIHGNYNPKKIDGGNYSLGKVNYFRTLTPGEGRAVFLPLTNESVHNPSVIESEEVLRALLLPTSFAFKKQVYQKQRGTNISQLVVDAILYDLFLEMDVADIVCEVSDCTLDLMSKMNLLRDGVLSSPTQNEIYILAAVNLYLDELESSDLKSNYKKLLGEALTSSDVKAMTRTLELQAKERKGYLPGIDSRKNIRNMLALPAVHRAITTDSVLRNGNIIDQEFLK